jgi:selenocysteine lyase/cysteine desulfurase
MTLENIRTKFPITRRYNFLDHAGVSPLSGPAADALANYARQHSESAYLEANYYRTIDHIRQAAARLINAHADELSDGPDPPGRAVQEQGRPVVRGRDPGLGRSPGRCARHEH